ncbi:MAG: response regulator [Planctomycetes bacterium]|nr:response regulator [Planctomycetota bacterium]
MQAATHSSTPACVLVVEDNPADVELLREAISDRGAPLELLHAENAIQAYEALAGRGPWADAKPPQAILLDINLPIISGKKILEIVRQYDDWKHIPVVMLTSSQAEVDRAACAALGATAYLTKPPTYDGYLALADRVVDILGAQPRQAKQSA